MSRFDAETAVADGAVDVSPDHGGFLGASGGYVCALALRAMAEAVADPMRPPRSLAVQLLAPMRAEPRVAVAVALERRGRAATFASVRLDQDGAAVARAQATFGVSAASPTRIDAAMPVVPPPADCAPLVRTPVAGATGFDVLEHRPAPGSLPLRGGDDAEILVWMRLAEHRPLDAVSAVYLADGAVPALWGSLEQPVLMPSAEIQLHLVAATAPTQWVLGVFRSRVAGGGWAVEDGELWGQDGALILISRQLRRML